MIFILLNLSMAGSDLPAKVPCLPGIIELNHRVSEYLPASKDLPLGHAVEPKPTMRQIRSGRVDTPMFILSELQPCDRWARVQRASGPPSRAAGLPPLPPHP
jgi:hypothetical protein